MRIRRRSALSTARAPFLKIVFRIFCAISLLTLCLRPLAAEALENVFPALPASLPLARVNVGAAAFDAEVARSSQQQAHGLMGRAELGAGRAMLFPFDTRQRTAFWMKDCRMPLDIVFYRDLRVTRIVANAPPCAVDPCPVYRSLDWVDGALEISGGEAARLGLRVGDAVVIAPQHGPFVPARSRPPEPGDVSGAFGSGFEHPSPLTDPAQ
ncbi:MAG: DUF192 domain-containing protein [Vampirovibrionales bacterium]|nr:DUF192 domain-containing protein [Vampirovibrionales bacterium]